MLKTESIHKSKVNREEHTSLTITNDREGACISDAMAQNKDYTEAQLLGFFLGFWR